MSKKVLLTGISGYVGQHCAVELLKKGYKVKGSVRSVAKEEEVRKGLAKVVDAKDNLEFCELDLLSDIGWEAAMKDCDYVLHVASPFFITAPKDENEMIKPAVEGALRALKFAKRTGIKKVVLTSSTVAMAGDIKVNHLTQNSWTNPKSNNISAYIKSKTLAEKAAWDFYKNQEEGHKIELTVINPGPVYGPTLTGNISGASMDTIYQLITGKMNMQPNASYVMSDVRDIAKIHVAAIENEASNGQRFIVTSEEPHQFVEMAAILKKNGYAAVPRKAPTFLLNILSLFNRDLKGMKPFFDVEITANITPTKETFNWEPIPFEKTMIDSAKSIEHLV